MKSKTVLTRIFSRFARASTAHLPEFSFNLRSSHELRPLLYKPCFLIPLLAGNVWCYPPYEQVTLHEVACLISYDMLQKHLLDSDQYPHPHATHAPKYKNKNGKGENGRREEIRDKTLSTVHRG